jgi:hypothetical protein
MRYKAFISYSHVSDGKLASALQSALQSFAKPFFRLRALKIFRDATDLRITPRLWLVIQNALRESDFFILLASPHSAQSEWVTRELGEWLALHSGDSSQLIIVLTGGDLRWDPARSDFEWTQTTSLPRILEHHFDQDPYI